MDEPLAATERDQMVLDCQGLVRHLAMQLRSRTPAWIETDDLISYGQVGLLQAARDFDPGQGTKFSTFAFYRIRGAIFDGVNKLMWFRAARSPETRYEQMSDEVIQAAAGEPPAAAGQDSLAAEASWFTRLASSLAVVYFAAADEPGGAVEVPDQSAEAPWSGLVQQETRVKLRDAMERLPPDAAALIRAVYYEDRTLQEAANRLGISKSWASRMHARALEQMGKSLRASSLDEAPD